MRRILLMLAVAATASATVYGAAASLGGLQAQSVAADTTTITPCDSDGVRIRQWNTLSTAGRTFVTHANLDHIHDACAGKQLVVRLYDGNGEVLSDSGGLVPTASGTNDIEVTVSVGGWPIPDVASVEVLIQDAPLAQP